MGIEIQMKVMHWLRAALLLAGFTGVTAAPGAALPEVVAMVKPSIVAVGSYQRLRQPPARYMGTGFVVGKGDLVITNAHVIPAALDQPRGEYLSVFVGVGRRPQVRRAEQVLRDEEHDLSLLRIDGAALTPLRVGDSARVREGQEYAFTGFPIGMVLGMFPVTHRGIVSAISPVAIPAHTSRNLDAKQIQRLRAGFDVFQLDATAYPGNSGSPLYATDTGQVVGVINKVFVKQTKENLLKDPSGITYAIPGRHVHALLERWRAREDRQ